MKKTTILFDLDGTLLPINETKFIESYFGLMAKFFASDGIDPKQWIQNVWLGTKAMRANLGPDTNEQVFWKVFREVQKNLPDYVEEKFYSFYETQFDLVKDSSTTNPLARDIVLLAKQKGYRLILATNPLFPRIATLKRITWAGLDESMFSHITTYENAHACKPSLAYYQEILDQFQLQPQECMMVGNDALEDGITLSYGMDFFLLTDQLLNQDALAVDKIPHGSFLELLAFIRQLPNV